LSNSPDREFAGKAGELPTTSIKIVLADISIKG